MATYLLNAYDWFANVAWHRAHGDGVRSWVSRCWQGIELAGLICHPGSRSANVAFDVSIMWTVTCVKVIRFTGMAAKGLLMAWHFYVVASWLSQCHGYPRGRHWFVNLVPLHWITMWCNRVKSDPFEPGPSPLILGSFQIRSDPTQPWWCHINSNGIWVGICQCFWPDLIQLLAGHAPVHTRPRLLTRRCTLARTCHPKKKLMALVAY